MLRYGCVLAYFCWIVFTGNFIQVRDTSYQNLSVKKLTVELVLVSILGLVEPWTIYDIFLTINGLSMHLRKKRASGLNNAIYIRKKSFEWHLHCIKAMYQYMYIQYLNFVSLHYLAFYLVNARSGWKIKKIKYFHMC